MKDRYVSGIGSQIAYGQVAASRALDAHNMTIDPRNPGTGCSLDGVKVQCDKLLRAANQGALKSITFSTTGGMGGVGGDTGILAGVFSNAQGSLKRNQNQACQNNCAIGPDGEPITPATVFPTNFFFGFGAGFGLTGEQQKEASKNDPLKCTITLGSRPINSNVVGWGMGFHHMFVTVQQSDEAVALVWHAFPGTEGRAGLLTGRVNKFEKGDVDYDQFTMKQQRGVSSYAIEIPGKCDEVRKSFDESLSLINDKKYPYPKGSENAFNKTNNLRNSNAFVYTLLLRLGTDRYDRLRLGYKKSTDINRAPGWGTNLLP